MNILLVANELRYTCGVTNHLLHLSKGLSQRLSNDPSNKIFILCGGGKGIERFSDINTEIINNEKFLHEKRNPINYLLAVRFLKSFASEKKIDIIHSHTHYAANIAARAFKTGNKIKTIQTNHGLLEQKGRLKHFNADKYIAINEHIYEYIIKNNIAERENIKLIRCGIPVPDIPPQKNNKKLKVIAASRFIREKGLDTYINAVSLLDERLKQKAEFFIAGEGELEKELKKQNKDKNAGITFLGSIKDLYPVLAETDALVFPSRSKTEGFPAVITEAGANNTLVITSDFSSLGNIIENNQDGIIFKQNNYEQLSLLLTKFIENREEYVSIALKFYEKTKKLFSIDEMIDKHLKLYNEVLKA